MGSLSNVHHQGGTYAPGQKQRFKLGRLVTPQLIFAFELRPLGLVFEQRPFEQRALQRLASQQLQR